MFFFHVCTRRWFFSLRTILACYGLHNSTCQSNIMSKICCFSSSFLKSLLAYALYTVISNIRGLTWRFGAAKGNNYVLCEEYTMANIPISLSIEHKFYIYVVRTQSVVEFIYFKKLLSLVGFHLNLQLFRVVCIHYVCLVLMRLRLDYLHVFF